MTGHRPFLFDGRRRALPDDPLCVSGLRPGCLYDQDVDAVSIDLRRFRDGMPGGRREGHTGRPLLATQIWQPWLRAARDRPPGRRVVAVTLWGATHLWRALDDLDAETAVRGLQAIGDVREIPGIVWTRVSMSVQSRIPSSAREALARAGRLIADALTAMEVDGLTVPPFVPAVPGRPRVSGFTGAKPTYGVATVAAILAACRVEAEGVERRVAQAHALADQATWDGVRPAGHPGAWCRADALAFVRTQLADAPSVRNFEECHGFRPSTIPAMPDISPALAGGRGRSGRMNGCGRNLVGALRNFMPTSADLVPFVVGALCYGSLNPETLLNLSRYDWLRDQPTGPTVRGRKGRAGGAEVQGPSAGEAWSLHDIIARAVTLTEPVRRIAERRLGMLKASPINPADGRERALVDAEIKSHAALRNRIWVSLRVQPVGVHRMTFDGAFWDVAARILAHHAVPTDEVGARWSARAARRLFARTAWEAGGMTLAAAMLALEHGSEDTTNAYLDQRGIMAREEELLRSWQDGHSHETSGAFEFPRDPVPPELKEGVVIRRPTIVLTAEALARGTPGVAR